MESLTTRASLLVRIRNWDDHDSWSEFFELYQGYVLRIALRAGLNQCESEDVAQEVFRHVARDIRNFECNRERGSFRGWLRNRTRWCVQDKFRDRQRSPQTVSEGFGYEGLEDRTAQVADTSPSLEDISEREQQEYLLEQALLRLSRKTKPKHIQIFDLYHRQNWTVSRIAEQFDLNPATVYVVTHRLISKLKKELEFLEAGFDR